MPKRYAIRVAAALAVAAATVAGAAPALADTPGFTVNVTQAPDTFTVGNQPRTITAVASTDRARRCIKVRWVLLVSAQGVSLNQIRVSRIEGGGQEPVQAQLQEDSIRVADSKLDTGQLCKGQTDTAQWGVAFTGPDNGTVNFEARAFSERGQLLASSQASGRVVSPVAAQQTPSTPPPAKPSDKPSQSPSPDDSTSFSAQPNLGAVAPNRSSPDLEPAALAKKPGSGNMSLLIPGLLVGAVCVLIGVLLLMRLRARNRKADGAAWAQDTQTLPTGFYNMPERRRR